MKIKLILFVLLMSFGLYGQDTIRLMSWNIQNLGKSKSYAELKFMAHVMEASNIIAIQEVSTSKEGPAAVDSIVKILNTTTSKKWRRIISESTNGPGSEKYAYIFDTTVKPVAAGLAIPFDTLFDREPFLFFVKMGTRRIGLVNFHAVPAAKNPGIEIGHLVAIADKYNKYGMVFMGDFNTSQADPCFNALKFKGYDAALVKTKTSLKMKPDKVGGVFSAEYDNFFYSNYYIGVSSQSVYDITKSFKTFNEARQISDHCPIIIKIFKK